MESAMMMVIAPMIFRHTLPKAPEYPFFLFPYLVSVFIAEDILHSFVE